jgi:hypothetical protein
MIINIYIDIKKNSTDVFSKTLPSSTKSLSLITTKMKELINNRNNLTKGLTLLLSWIQIGTSFLKLKVWLLDLRECCSHQHNTLINIAFIKPSFTLAMLV